ncbi:MAG: glycogen/starch/alpha-glucan phosphorylase, partial [Kiritimatiellae bacterium]|nr:glycogen/starch/alpha-glucan phosphorylase [Kiritimatiellia bacterium]
MKVLYVASEAVPFIKTGGLADVAGSLPKALKEQGVDVRVILPKFGKISEKYRDAMEHVYDGTIPVSWRTKYVGIDKYELEGVTYYFVDNEEYFSREGLYGYDDDAERYSFLCRAILNCLPAIDFFPDVINANDWHAGLVPVLLKLEHQGDARYEKIKTIYTIHNLKYQGVFTKDVMSDVLGFAWEYRKPDKSINVKFNGNAYMQKQPDGSLKLVHENAMTVMAVPYDVPIVGYHNKTVNTLRLWNAEVNRDFSDYGMLNHEQMRQKNEYRHFVESITEYLYPDDSSNEGKRMRLIQEYFLVSAGTQSIIRHYDRAGMNIRELDKKIAIHINDTHPALCVAELMRILVDEYNLEWNEAWTITRAVVAYTNHTIMPEALEKWPVDMFKTLLPRIYMIIEELNRRHVEYVKARYPDNVDKLRAMSIIENGEVHMARLAIVGSHSVNGVARIHSDILKSTTLHDFYEYWPRMFNNKTNGITHRRW